VRLLDRLSTRLGSTRLDTALALAFVLVGLAQVIVWPIADGVIGELFVLGTTLPLAWRRTRPIESTLVMAGFFLIPTDGFAVLGFVVVILQLFALGTHGEPTRVVAAVTAFACGTSVVGTLLGPEPPVAAIGGVLVVVAPLLAGRLVRHLQCQNAALISLTEQLREERARAEANAVDAERARIAQELHDVVGHEVTLIAIQAEAATSALAVNPGRAAEPLEAIRTTAHQTLAEIRSVLNALSPALPSSGEPGSLGAGLETIAVLAARARAAGIPNTLTETGSPLPDEAPASLAVRRVVRECLTNAGRHAPGQPVTITVTWDPAAVCVETTNPADATSYSPGRGLAGLRHRAELLGGAFTASADGSTFTVRVRIPTGGAR
jgi:signal transduction histidine kinase